MSAIANLPSSQDAGSSKADWDGYRGPARKLLESKGARAGTRVRLVTSDGLEAMGLVVPRYEHAGDEQIVIKLKSGYNIGIRSSRVKELAIFEAVSSAPIFGAAQNEKRRVASSQATVNEEKTLLLMSTGGTIASRVDYRTGAVHPALSADDLYAAVPELGNIATIIPEVVFSTYSENLTPLHWQKLSESIIGRSNAFANKLDGIVIMLGTDTLAYVSAALSFSLLGLSYPVVCVGAQRSSDRPSSDAALNLKAAACFAVNSRRNSVYVAMHGSENDDDVSVHSGVRVRKNHTSRRDAFESIDAKLVARVSESQILFERGGEDLIEINEDSKFYLKTNFDPHVALVKFHPGFDPSILDYYVAERSVKGFIIEGSGLGHVSSDAVKQLARLTRQGIFAFMTSQCIWGHVDLNVYETGRDLIEAGVIPLENMISETAFAKLSWVLGNFPSVEVSEVMKRNLSGEFTDRIPLPPLPVNESGKEEST